MKYLLEEPYPCVECCEVKYEWEDQEEECLICGTPIDWEDIESAWDMDSITAKKDGEDGEEDENSPFYVSDTYRPKSKSEDEYYGSLFKDVDFMEGVRNGKQGKQPNISGKSREDPYLDTDPPNEVL